MLARGALVPGAAAVHRCGRFPGNLGGGEDSGRNTATGQTGSWAVPRRRHADHSGISAGTVALAEVATARSRRAGPGAVRPYRSPHDPTVVGLTRWAVLRSGTGPGRRGPDHAWAPRPCRCTVSPATARGPVPAVLVTAGILRRTCACRSRCSTTISGPPRADHTARQTLDELTDPTPSWRLMPGGEPGR